MISRNELLKGTSLDSGVPPNCSPDPRVVLNGTCRGKPAKLGLDDRLLCSHILLLGGTGSGKTNTVSHIISQLQRVMSSSDVMLVFDPKLDFVRFHRKDDIAVTYREQSLCRTGVWNLFKELFADGKDIDSIFSNASELADAVFADQLEGASQPFFPMAARDIFSAAVTAEAVSASERMDRFDSSRLNNKLLAEKLSLLDAGSLKVLLEPYKSLRGVLKYVGSGQSAQALGVFAELQTAANRFLTRGFRKEGSFSVRQTVKQRGGRTLFIEYDPSCGQALRPVYQLLTDLFLKEALSPLGSGRGRVYVVCDEAGMLGRLSHFSDALNFGRSLGLCVIAGLQSLEQLYESFGEYGGRSCAAAFQTVFCFHTNDEASRKYLSEAYGKNLSVMQYVTPGGVSAEECRSGFTVEDWDITGLSCGEAIVGLPYHSPFRFKTELFGKRVQR